MSVIETKRQYLPVLEKRWQLNRREIVELARDGRLSLWVDLFGVRFRYKAKDDTVKEEIKSSIELKFFGESLIQLCANAERGNVWSPGLHTETGKIISCINGVLRDGRKVLVERVTQPVDQWKKILLRHNEVFADLDEVMRLDDEFVSPGGENNHPEATPYLDAEHRHYSEELALAVKTWLALYGDAGNFQPNQAHKKQIESMLTKKGLSTAAVERIATLVNPRKKGGAPPSDI